MVITLSKAPPGGGADGPYQGVPYQGYARFARSYGGVHFGVSQSAATVLAAGNAGPWVAYAQQLLGLAYYAVRVDGIFGPETKNAVQTFQASRRLETDGIIGPLTWRELELVNAGRIAPPPPVASAPATIPVAVPYPPPSSAAWTPLWLLGGAAVVGAVWWMSRG